jgi:drug/metabolite transporter (DMT)-like permease
VVKTSALKNPPTHQNPAFDSSSAKVGLSFEAASKRAGSVAVNLIRLVMAFALLCAIGAIARGRPLPTDASAYQWKRLLISGVVGFFIGDLCLFRALVLLGARVTTLIMSLAPVLAAIAGYFLLDERLSSWSFVGMALTLAGIAWVVSERSCGAGEDDVVDPSGEVIAAEAGSSHAAMAQAASPPLAPSRSNRAQGVILGILGAAGQGVGLVITKIGSSGIHQYDPFAATQIRAIAGIVVFAALVLGIGRQRDVIRALANSRAMGLMTLGAVTGPFLGVSLLNASIQRISTGVAQTMAAMVPVLIIPFVVFLKNERISPRAIIGACVAVGGVAILMLFG